jgi:hypothetical protein
MKIHFALLAAFLLMSVNGYAQGTAPQPQPVPDALDHWRRATVSLGQIVDDGGTKYTTIASGVIIALDEHHGCILTAKHAVYDTVHSYVPTEREL